jgi:GTP-binding protein
MSGTAIDLVTKRKGEMINMEHKGDRVLLEFHIPSRGIIGLRTIMLTSTQGEAVMSHRFIKYDLYKGPIETRLNGSLVALETGTAFAYALNKLQDRGRYFIDPQEEIYAGQVVGECSREGDLALNLTKSKKLTNMRASGSDDKVRLAPPIRFSLEEALEYIQKDEYVEVTPKSIRLRKIILDEIVRKRAARKV